MANPDFNDLIWFLAVARDRSFTRAAAKLGIAQSTLSHAIKKLEAEMGLRLLTRTTRSVALTEAGERLRQSLEPRLEEIDRDIAALTALRDTPSGTVRITLSEHAMETIWPRLVPALAAYPDIALEFSIDTGFRNIVEDGFDAGIRLGESLEKDMIAVRVGPDWRLLAVCAPAYVAAHGKPKHPKDLIAHNCISRRQSTSGGLYAWEFEKGGQELRVRVNGQLTFNSSFAMIDAALGGFGIAYLPESMIAPHLASGALVAVLDSWSPPFEGYFLYYPSRRQNAPAFSVIVEALRYRGK